MRFELNSATWLISMLRHSKLQWGVDGNADLSLGNTRVLGIGETSLIGLVLA
eukprot:SAG11_NODE_4267_length_1978_cov_1.831293_3_plen_52_part_00